MPRQARKKSESGIYHVMLRGINKQQIFEDEEDRLKFLDTLAQYKEQCGYSIYAYCLMQDRGRFYVLSQNVRNMSDYSAFAKHLCTKGTEVT